MASEGLLDHDAHILPRPRPPPGPPRPPTGTPFVGKRRPRKVKPIPWEEIMGNRSEEMTTSAGTDCNENAQVAVNEDLPSSKCHKN